MRDFCHTISLDPANVKQVVGTRVVGTCPHFFHLINEFRMTNDAKTTETIAINFINILRLGPEVSLNGSPTVSPTTAALWAPDPLPPYSPPSMYFFTLSHAP